MHARADTQGRRPRPKRRRLRRKGRRLLPHAAALVALLLVALLLHSPVTPVAARQTQGIPAARVAQVLERARNSAALDDAAYNESLSIGYALIEEARYAEAAAIFDALIQRRPRDFAALYGDALATFNAGRAAEALALAQRAADISLRDTHNVEANIRASNALVLLAVIEAVRGDNVSALKSVRRAVELAPENFDAQLALGRALYGAGNDAEAVRAFRAAVALKPSDARALFFLATTLERAGDTEGALAAYRQLALKQPRAYEGHLGLGVMLMKRGGAETDEGIKELALALEIDPNLYEARVTLGRALLSKGRAQEAVEHLRRAAELAPGNPEPHYQLSLAYRKLGRRQEAAAESEIVERIHESRRKTGAANNPPDE